MSDSESDDEAVGPSIRQFLGVTRPAAKPAVARVRDTGVYERYRRPVASVRHRPSTEAAAADDDSVEDSSAEESDDSDDEEAGMPCSHELVLSAHNRSVAGLCIDPAGTRLATGSHGGDVATWNFGGMSADAPRPFWRSGTGVGGGDSDTHGQQVRSCAFSSTGAHLLVCRAGWQAQVLTRGGDTVCDTVKGDPYLLDLKATSGHVGELTGGVWHCAYAERFATWSADSTVRIWDLAKPRKNLQVLVHRSKATAGTGRVKCTAAAYAASDAGKTLGACYADGTVSLWQPDAAVHRPMGGSVPDAHAGEGGAMAIAFSLNGHTLATRSRTAVKLWDRRNFTKPVSDTAKLGIKLDTAPDSAADLVFSPNNQELVTPHCSYRQTVRTTGDLSGDGDTDTGIGAENIVLEEIDPALYVLSTRDLRLVKTVPLDSAAVRVVWHAKLDQALVGRSDGRVSMLFAPPAASDYSAGAGTGVGVGGGMGGGMGEVAGGRERKPAGAMLVISRAPKRRHIDDLAGTAGISEQAGIDAAAALFGSGSGGSGGGGGGQRKREAGYATNTKNAAKGHDKGVAAAPPGAQRYTERRDVLSDEMRRYKEHDPREALLRYADKSDATARLAARYDDDDDDDDNDTGDEPAAKRQK